MINSGQRSGGICFYQEVNLGHEVVLLVLALFVCKDHDRICAKMHDFFAWVQHLEVQHLDEEHYQLI